MAIFSISSCCDVKQRLNRTSFRWILVGCEQVVCRKNRSCMVDHYKKAYCVKCPECSTHHNKSGPVCGADGLQYESSCHLRWESCRQGKAIGFAYRGRCIGTLDSSQQLTSIQTSALLEELVSSTKTEEHVKVKADYYLCMNFAILRSRVLSHRLKRRQYQDLTCSSMVSGSI